MEGGTKIGWGEPNLHAKRRQIGEESSKVVCRKEIDGGGKLGSDKQHNHGNLNNMQKGNRRGRG
jgi:hypothetical protein